MEGFCVIFTSFSVLFEISPIIILIPHRLPKFL